MGDVTLHLGDCLEVLPTFSEGMVNACVTDPPYGLSFMGKGWDGMVPGEAYWRAVLRVLKPGGYLLAMGGSRTYHRLACAVEDAGFEVRDCIMFMYGVGFPKSKACLKPAYEPILLARKPGPKVLPLGIEECRVPTDEDRARPPSPNRNAVTYAQDSYTKNMLRGGRGEGNGRWPANVCHDGSEEVLEAFAAFGSSRSPRTYVRATAGEDAFANVYMGGKPRPEIQNGYGDTGTAARFFYTAKASKAERGEGNGHPTVKPLALMRWLVRLVCPAGGVVLDPFLGSGTTALACQQEGRGCVGVERDPGYLAIVQRRIEEARQTEPLFSGEGT